MSNALWGKDFMRSWLQSFVTGRITVMVIPRASKDIRSYRVPVSAVYGTLLLALAGTVATGNALLRTAEFSHAKKEVVRLAGENHVLAGELVDVRARIDGLNEEVALLTSFEERIRAVADLAPIDADVREMGVGGPVVGARPDLLSLRAGRPEQALELNDARGGVETLTRKAERLQGSLDEVLHTLTARREELNRTPSIMPVENSWITSGYGYRHDPYTGKRTMHHGLDLSARRGEPVVATADGVVRIAGWKGYLGLTIEIEHGDGVSTVYGHNHRLFVKSGQEVERGQVIAAVGSSGRSTNPHLHYEVRVNGRTVNPKPYILR